MGSPEDKRADSLELVILFTGSIVGVDCAASLPQFIIALGFLSFALVYMKNTNKRYEEENDKR